MARSNIPMVINLRQNTNDDSTAFGKYFAEVDAKEPLNLKGLAKHMMEHGKISSEEMCNLVLGEMVKCLVHLLREGQPVKLDGFGTFSPSVDGQGLGRAAHLACAEEGVRLRVGLRGGERRTHHRREEEAFPEQDADQFRARTPGRQCRWRR